MSTTTTTPTTPTEDTPTLSDRLSTAYTTLSDLRSTTEGPGRKAFITRKMIVVWDKMIAEGVDTDGMTPPKGATGNTLEGLSDDTLALLTEHDG